MDSFSYLQSRLQITEALLSDVIEMLIKIAPQHAVEAAFRATAAHRALEELNKQTQNEFNLAVLHAMGADDKTPFQ